MARYALLLEYDGSNYCGWQIQNNAPTVQESLELALSKFANHSIKTITAGRTDTGVHALNQVVHFDSDSKRNLFGWINGVNSQLDSSIRVKEVCLVNDDFDARFSALSRTYHYYLQIRPTASVHLHKYVGWYFQDLYLNRMQEAARLLVGRYDFSSFRASGCQANSPIREIKYLQIERRENMIKFSICANAFLHHMVRNIVGALLYVGNGKLSVAEFKNVFQAADRTKAPPTFMPQGLYLANVEYPSQIFGSSSDIWLYNG